MRKKPDIDIKNDEEKINLVTKERGQIERHRDTNKNNSFLILKKIVK